jgi:uncharacterized membrane protein
MNRHDRELLDKQLRNVQAPAQNEGALMLAMLAVFCIGMAVGGFIYAYTDAPAQGAGQIVQIAANDTSNAGRSSSQ